MGSSINARELALTSGDGTPLYAVVNRPKVPIAVALLVHGFGDHCRRYDAVTAFLNEQNIAVLRFDYRGHGRSSGRRGHIYQFQDYVRDLNAARECLERQNDGGLPQFVMAHSYGGLIATHTLARDPSRIHGLIMSSPFFGFAIKVPLWKTAAGILMSRYMPAFSMPTDIDPRSVSHEPAIVQGYATDPLIGRVATSRWFTETKKAHAELPTLAPQLNMPILLQQAGEDRLVDGSAGRAVFDLFGSEDKTWEDKPGQFHEIWFETAWQKTMTTVCDWLTKRATPSQ